MDDAGGTLADDQEARRLRALDALRAFDGDPADPRFDRIVRLASRLFSAPRAAIRLIGKDRVWLKAKVGFDHDEEPRPPGLTERLREDGVVSQPDLAGAPDQTLRPWCADSRFFACAPLKTPSGEIVGLLTVEDTLPRDGVDIGLTDALADLAALAMEELLHDAETARNVAERTLDSDRIALALHAANLGEFVWDMVTDTVRISARMARITEVPEGLAPAQGGETLYAFVHPDEREAIRAEVQAQLRSQGRYEVEFRRVSSDPNRVIWNSVAGLLVKDAAGKPLRLIGVVQDITARKDADDQRENLLTELDHRIKNILAVVQSVAGQSARKASSLDGFLKAFNGRLKSMSSAHDLLSAARWRGATLARIAAAELGGVAPNQTRWDGPELFLTPRAAAALSLTLHELAVNAVKYGSLSVESGRVEVVWREAPGGGFNLEWLETGGPMTSPPDVRGFGMTLIEDVVGRELGGRATIEYKRSGVTAMIHGAADALVDEPEPEPVEAPDARIVETVGGGDDSFKAGDIAGLKVLIVEDSLLLAMELEAGLEDSGVEVVGCAAELSEALQMLELTFDAAVLDADLNGQSVAPVAEILRREGRPFVFATGYADKAAPMGFDAPIVRKPYNVHQIARALASVTGR
ncbi:histidine kinase [Caulobacter sp. Root1455]|uniref:HWE histidine kinase domain-containing protein n=1 Tax=unclassified Caulobacter TaxID=2648921 RepID=UPI0006FD8C73|nr:MULTISPECIES: HWE histidine kinase domain-containing protein [unclassified Caulobacter]KQY35061.1 histidine kinase [Caulobacter sp. Root487D2Y]KQZ02828.1 histidine kinase [Caulobacter sp. Root1455]